MTHTASNTLTIASDEKALIEQDFQLHEQFLESLIHDERLIGEIPHGVVLVLIPDKNPELAEANLRTAIEAAQQGRNVYVRHVYRQNTPSEQYGDYTYGPYPPEPAERDDPNEQAPD